MNRRRTFLTVMITLLVVAAVFAAGFAVYRLGYSQGVHASATTSMPGPMIHDFGGRLPEDFEGHFYRGMPHGDMFRRIQQMPIRPAVGFGFIPGFLLFIGAAALVILAINSFRNQTPADRPRLADSDVSPQSSIEKNAKTPGKKTG